MFGADISAALPSLRSLAESLMVDECVVTGPGSTPVWNDATGTYDTTAGATLYAGRCRIQIPNTAENAADAGERAWTVQDALVMLPVDGSESVAVGSTVTVTAARFDAALVGRTYTVSAEHSKTFATARRLRCQEVTA